MERKEKIIINRYMERYIETMMKISKFGIRKNERSFQSNKP